MTVVLKLSKTPTFSLASLVFLRSSLGLANWLGAETCLKRQKILEKCRKCCSGCWVGWCAARWRTWWSKVAPSSWNVLHLISGSYSKAITITSSPLDIQGQPFWHVSIVQLFMINQHRPTYKVTHTQTHPASFQYQIFHPAWWDHVGTAAYIFLLVFVFVFGVFCIWCICICGEIIFAWHSIVYFPFTQPRRRAPHPIS